MTELERYFNELLILSGKVNLLVLLFPILVGILNRSFLNKALKVFFYYKLADLSINLFEQIYLYLGAHYLYIWNIMDSLNLLNTSFLVIISHLITYYFVGKFYSLILLEKEAIWVKRISWFLFFVSIIIYFFIDGYNKQGSVNQIIYRFYIFFVLFLYVRQVYKSLPAVSLWKNSYFLISIGLFIPNLLSLMMSFTSDKLYETDFVLFIKLSLFRNGFGVIAEIFFAYAFYQARYLKFLERS